MTAETVSCTFDKEAVWRKVYDRKAVALDMNCWIKMVVDKSTLSTRVKGTLRKLVTELKGFLNREESRRLPSVQKVLP